MFAEHLCLEPILFTDNTIECKKSFKSQFRCVWQCNFAAEGPALIVTIVALVPRTYAQTHHTHTNVRCCCYVDTTYTPAFKRISDAFRLRARERTNWKFEVKKCCLSIFYVFRKQLAWFLLECFGIGVFVMHLFTVSYLSCCQFQA